ncbi:MAG: isoprenylcysteine carboxylmethyltransferase family protein [Candidatus Aminicenantes bacterium]|nr:MAG: isoprenylcysteine carboxylmethyltransferase family protein [Candidatus Aminicenantes bacterium]
MSNKDSSKLKIAVKIVIMTIFFMVLIFVPAGTFKWPEAWIFLFLYFSWLTAMIIWMKKNDPGLLKERMTARKKKDVKHWDKIFMFSYSLLVLVLFVLPGLDAVRCRWSQVPLLIKVIGFLGFIPAMSIVFWTMKENTYLSEMVRIQEERGHQVCTTGPYQYVRHPMYVGVIIFLFCFPLAMGSLYSLIPAFVTVILFFFRTALEDKTLHNELSGYKEYAQKVRYRLIPGVW